MNCNMDTMVKLSKTILFGLISGFIGCGYGFQTSRNPLFEKEGIEKVYISPLANGSSQPGAEVLVYNNLVKNILSSRRVKVVSSAADADAILEGGVTGAGYGVSNLISVSSLLPATSSTVSAGLGTNLPTRNVGIAQEYAANLSASFTLKRAHPKPGEKVLLWTGDYSRGKPFPAANQLDIPGTTSALINESEFDRALSDLAILISNDAQQSMFAMF